MSSEEQKNPDKSKSDIKSKNAIMMKRIAYIRHGQALHNVYKKHLFTPDNPLTKTGQMELKQLRNKLLKNKFYDTIKLVITSPLLRALQTTEILFNDMNISILVTPIVTERYSATCDEGTKKSVLLKKYPIYGKWNGWNNINECWWDTRSQNINERYCDFAENRCKALHKLIKMRKEKCIAVVGHGGIFKKLLNKWLKNGEIYWVNSMY